MSDLKAQLSELRDLLESGLIDDADFARQKQALLDAAVSGSPLDGRTRVGGTVPGAAPNMPARLGSYDLLEVIGSGGMGTVVRGRHIEPGWSSKQGGDVAIKVINPEIASDARFRERFFSEASLGRRIQHPGIASVFDVLSDGTWLGTVMSLVDGETLEGRVRTPNPLADVIALLEPLAAALDHLHAQGVVHRDLKPANIKVQPDGQPVLLDLGIARDLADTNGITATATALGTVEWMAPEQIEGRRVGPEADRYSLGLLTYALLAGRLPWPAGTNPFVLATLKTKGRLQPLPSTLSPHIGHAVGRMLEVDPSRRFASTTAFVAALGRPHRTTPPRARPKPAGRPPARRPPPIARPSPTRGYDGPDPTLMAVGVVGIFLLLLAIPAC